MQVLRQLMQRPCAQHAPHQCIHRVTGIFFQIIVQFSGGGAIGAAQFIGKICKETAPFEKGTPPPQQLRRTGHDGIDEHLPQILCIHRRVPAITQPGKLRGKPGLVQHHGLLIGGRFFHVLPVRPEGIVMQQSTPYRQKMRLQMLRHLPAKTAAHHGIVARQTPEIQFRAGFHPSKQFFQVPHRSRQRVIDQQQFVKSGQRLPAHRLQCLPVGAHIQPAVGPFQHSDTGLFGPAAAVRVEYAVGDKQHFLRYLPECLHRQTAGNVQNSLPVIMKIDGKSFQCSILIGAFMGAENCPLGFHDPFVGLLGQMVPQPVAGFAAAAVFIRSVMGKPVFSGSKSAG